MRVVATAFVIVCVVGCIGLPRQPESETAHLTLAANCLDRDDAAGAVPHLVAHVERTPDQPAIRSLLAAQYASLGQWREAKAEYERAILEYGDDRESVATCYTRLVQVAGELDDERLEQRSRGIGLLLVVQGWDDKPTLRGDEERVQRTLTQALENLRPVCEADRTDAIVHVYLGDCLMRLRQPSAARAAFAVARNAPPGEVPDAIRAMIPE